MTNKHSYRITIETDEASFGQRIFQETMECDSQTKMRKHMAYAIARAMRACLCDPPTGADICLANENLDEGSENPLIAGLVYAYDKWDCTADFDGVVSVVVNVGQLNMDASSDEKARIVRHLESYGIEVLDE